MNRYLVFVLIIGFCGASNYVINGDFELPLDTGWEQSLLGYGIIGRDTGVHPDPGYELYLQKFSGSSGHAEVSQIADIPTTKIDFSVQAKLYAWDNHSGAWAGAGVFVYYCDESEALLGETVICMGSPQCPWQDSPTRHVITVADSSWHDHSFNIHEELANIPAVQPADVKKIKVMLSASVSHC